jgi:hypothetical protein
LLLAKRMAVAPRHNEKCIVVIRVVEPEPPAPCTEQVELDRPAPSRPQSCGTILGLPAQ